ncbi:MAG: transketolase [Calditrichaeota bacterium]|nr:MAG: transketolase [Calditrichota bacterium]
MSDNWRGFTNEKLDKEQYEKITEAARICRGNILKMTTLAMSGHPGGSMSSIETYLLLYMMSNIDPKDTLKDDRDRIIISHGHTSPGAYTALAAAGFFSADEAIAGFRLAGSPFEGHVERSVPGIEWGTGNLGQGLSVGIGKAIYARLSNQNFHSFVFMGDGEQQKGQISESRRIAAKYKLSKLTAIVDYNQLQISGNIKEVLPQNITDEWKADGWNVIEVDGHDLYQLYDAMYKAYHNESAPIMILAKTTMGKGVSFMEDKHGYHGAPVKPDQLTDALKELGCENDLERYKELRASFKTTVNNKRNEYPKISSGDVINYAADAKSDNRSAFGKALESVAAANIDKVPFAVFDCDLAGSVKTAGFEKTYPDNFFQFGISEHSTATTTGSLSAEKAVSIWADFGMFAIAETYNQARLSDINHSNVKLFCTHCGLNVGEDGMTHQSIDYFALLNSTFGWKVITPADANQTDKAVRYALASPGNFAIIMGRAVIPIITDENGQPLFGEGYNYTYGRMDEIRSGKKTALVCAGNMAFVAVEAYTKLKDAGVDIALYSISDWSDLHDDDMKKLASFENLVTLEDHNVKTGLGTALTDALYKFEKRPNIEKIGVSEYGSSGKPADLYKLQGMDADSVTEKIKKLS